MGYLRVLTEPKNLNNQKLAILYYTQKHRLQINKFEENTISSLRSLSERKILDLLDQLKENDIPIISKLSRLGHSTMEVLALVNQLV